MLRGEQRLVTIVGPPGVGKTRLAVHVARLWRSVGHPTLFGDLSSRTSPEQLLDTVARALGLPLATPGDLPEALATAEAALFGRGDLVVVLDNADTLTPQAVEALDGWLDVASELRVLVTSRRRLDSRHEHAVQLDPLSSEEAIELFVERARRLLPDFPPADAPEHALEQVVERLDRLPLALELAAGRLNVMSLESMLERLDSARDASAPGLDPGQQVSDSLGESWRQLSPAGQAALAQASLFAGGFTLEAAEAVLELPGEGGLVETLAELRDRSLLIGRRDGAVLRFEMLHLVLGFARRQLEADPAALEDAADRFVAWLARTGRALLKQSYGADAVSAVRQLALEQDNLAAAAALAVERHPRVAATLLLTMEPLVASRRPLGTYEDLAATVAERLDPADDRDMLTRIWLAHARACHLRGEVESAASSLERAHGLVDSSSSLRAEILAERGMLADSAGRRVEALADLGAAIDIARSTGDNRLQGLAHGLLVTRHLLDGDERLATKHGAKALLCHERAGDSPSAAHAAELLGRAYVAAGDHRQGTTLLRHALERFEEIGDDAGAAAARLGLSRIALAQSDTDRAIQLLDAAISTYRRLGLVPAVGTCLQLQAVCALEAARPSDAERLLHEALDAHRGTSRNEMGVDSAWLAVADTQRGRSGLAVMRLEAAVDDLREAGREREADGFELMLATLMALEGDTVDAQRRVESYDGRNRSSEHPELTALRAAVSDVVGLPAAQGAGDAVSPRIRLVRTWLEGSSPLTGPESVSDGPTLVLERRARWFRFDEASQVELPSRSPGRLVLLELARLRLSAPGRSLDTEGVFSAGWPGEKAIAAAARNRVYVTIRRLRAAGLDGVLMSNDEGYFLDPAVRVSWAGEA